MGFILHGLSLEYSYPKNDESVKDKIDVQHGIVSIFSNFSLTNYQQGRFLFCLATKGTHEWIIYSFTFYILFSMQSRFKPEAFNYPHGTETWNVEVRIPLFVDEV